MDLSDYLSIGALILSGVSFWHSSRSSRLAKKVAAAEKRTEIHGIMVEGLLVAQELQRILHIVLDNESSQYELPKGLDDILNELNQIVETTQGRLEWLRSTKGQDPVDLEEYKIYAFEISARLRDVAPLIKNTEVISHELEGKTGSESNIL